MRQAPLDRYQKYLLRKIYREILRASHLPPHGGPYATNPPIRE